MDTNDGYHGKNRSDSSELQLLRKDLTEHNQDLKTAFETQSDKMTESIDELSSKLTDFLSKNTTTNATILYVLGQKKIGHKKT